MGCCVSCPLQPENPNSGNRVHPDTNVNPRHRPLPQPPARETAPSQPPAEGTTPFLRYALAELWEATDGFSRHNRISKGGCELPNFAYRGRLPDGQQIAVKRLSWFTWPDPEQFREEVNKLGRLRHRRLVNLIGYCIDGVERLLVAEFMPNDSLDRHLFYAKNKIIEWFMSLRVACYIAEALEYCSNEGQALYYDLNPNKVLFDEAGDPCLSCFGLLKNRTDRRWYNTNFVYTPPECFNGMVTHESVIFSFGIILLELLSGKGIRENQAWKIRLGQQIPINLDSHLKGEYSSREANALEELVSQCLQHKSMDRPTIKDVIATLAQVQSNVGVASHAMPVIVGQDKIPTMWETQKQDKTTPSPQSTSFPMAEAIAKMDLTTIDEILVLAHYKGDEASREVLTASSAQQTPSGSNHSSKSSHKSDQNASSDSF